MTVLLDMLDATPWLGAAGCPGPVCAFTSEAEARRYRDRLAATIRGYDFHVRGDGIPLFDGRPPESFGAEWTREDIRHWRAVNPVIHARESAIQ